MYLGPKKYCKFCYKIDVNFHIYIYIYLKTIEAFFNRESFLIFPFKLSKWQLHAKPLILGGLNFIVNSTFWASWSHLYTQVRSSLRKNWRVGVAHPCWLQSSTNCNAILEDSSVLQSIFTSFVNLVFNILVVSKPYLWHLRLDHVSDNKLNVLQHTLPDVITFHSNKDCILCPVTK